MDVFYVKSEHNNAECGGLNKQHGITCILWDYSLRFPMCARQQNGNERVCFEGFNAHTFFED